VATHAKVPVTGGLRTKHAVAAAVAAMLLLLLLERLLLPIFVLVPRHIAEPAAMCRWWHRGAGARRLGCCWCDFAPSLNAFFFFVITKPGRTAGGCAQ